MAKDPTSLNEQIKARLLAQTEAEMERELPELIRLAEKWNVRLIFPGDETRASQSEAVAPSNENRLVGNVGPMSSLTLGELIKAFLADPDSTFQNLQYSTRVRHEQALRLTATKYGDTKLSDIGGRTIKAWYDERSENGKRLATGHAFAVQLRTLFNFGASMLGDAEAARLSGIARGMRFPIPKGRAVRLTSNDAHKIRVQAHKDKYPSIALAQAFQELGLLQKDVIGEWVPVGEPGKSPIPPHRGKKWIRGLTWQDMDSDLRLFRKAGKGESKEIDIDLKRKPVVLAELEPLLADSKVETDGPLVICEYTGRPWIPGEFRRKWRMIARAAGLPENIRNSDSGPDGGSDDDDDDGDDA